LAEGQFDANSLLPYPILDPVVQAYIEEYIGDFKRYVNWATDVRPGFVGLDSDMLPTQEDYERMIRLIDRNEFKRRQAAPGIKVSKVAFGSGRRIPIVKGNEQF